MKIPFIDLSRQYRYIKSNIFTAFEMLFESQSFLNGAILSDFENSLAQFLGVKYVIGVDSGFSGLYLSLSLLNLKKDDEVIVPVFTHPATISAIIKAGGKPVLADINENTFNISQKSIVKKINEKTRAIILVHLFGHPADISLIKNSINNDHITIIEDSSQAFGSTYEGQYAGTFGDFGVFSFYPTYTLGTYGDGGAIVTNSEKAYKTLKMLRNYGLNRNNEAELIGINGKLDNIQAIILKEKLKYIENWVNLRHDIAELYKKYFLPYEEDEVSLFDLKEYISPPFESGVVFHNYNQYTIKAKERDRLFEYLKRKDIETRIFYRKPIHLQKAFAYLGYKRGDFPVAEQIASEVISLPIYPELSEDEIKIITKAIKSFYKGV